MPDDLLGRISTCDEWFMGYTAPASVDNGTVSNVLTLAKASFINATNISATVHWYADAAALEAGMVEELTARVPPRHGCGAGVVFTELDNTSHKADYVSVRGVWSLCRHCCAWQDTAHNLFWTSKPN
jgi:hypothetical protein